MIRRHMKPNAMAPQGIVEKESSMHISNVALIDPDSKKATRIKTEVDKDGNKKRIAVRSGKEIKKLLV